MKHPPTLPSAACTTAYNCTAVIPAVSIELSGRAVGMKLFFRQTRGTAGGLEVFVGPSTTSQMDDKWMDG